MSKKSSRLWSAATARLYAAYLDAAGELTIDEARSSLSALLATTAEAQHGADDDNFASNHVLNVLDLARELADVADHLPDYPTKQTLTSEALSAFESFVAETGCGGPGTSSHDAYERARAAIAAATAMPPLDIDPRTTIATSDEPHQVSGDPSTIGASCQHFWCRTGAYRVLRCSKCGLTQRS